MTDEAQRYDNAVALSPTKSDVAGVVACLGDASWRVRKAAVQGAMRFAKDARLVPALIGALADGDNAGLRNAASEALVMLGEPAVPELARSLARGDADQRKFIVEVLGAIGTPDAQTALFAVQDDADVNVRAVVAESLGRIGGEQVINRLRGRLQGTQNDLQAAVYVLDALARAGARVPLAELQWFATNPSLARSLYPVLGNTADPRVVPLLVEAIGSAPEGNRFAAILALDILVHDTGSHAELGAMLAKHQRAHERLLLSLDAESDAVVASTIVLLATTRDPQLAPRFLTAAACRTIVETAVMAVLELGRSTTKHLLAEVDRVGVEARVLILETLESLADPAAVKDLLELAHGPEMRSAEAAMRALGAFGDVSVIAPLVEVGREDDPELSRQAAFALVAVGLRFPDEVAEAVRALVDDGDWRAGWLTVLGAIGRESDMDVLVSGARHTDAEVRCAAIDAAATFADRFPRQTLVFALADEHEDVRAAATRALGSYKGEEVVSALVAACTDPSTQVVVSALRSLGAVGGPRATKTLLTAVAATSSPVAIAALQSLFVVAPVELEDAIRVGVRHIDPEVVREAIDVTLRLPASNAAPHLITALSHHSWNVRRAAAESLVNRAMSLPSDILSECLRMETEPLVRDELERLSRVGGRA